MFLPSDPKDWLSLFLAFVISMRCIVQSAMCRRKYIFNSMTRFLNALNGIPCHTFLIVIHVAKDPTNVEQRTTKQRKLYLLHSSDEKNDGEWWLLLSLLRRLWESKWFSVASNKTMEWLTMSEMFHLFFLQHFTVCHYPQIKTRCRNTGIPL